MGDYRPCAGVVLFNSHGLVWVGERIDAPGAWQLPQGGIGRGEEPYAAALRELREETGAEHVVLLGEAPGWLRYDLPAALRGQVWKGRYCGQEQKWFAFRHLGADEDIDIATESPEFKAWRWVPLSTLPALAIAFKRPTYEALVQAFGAFAGESTGP